MRKYKFNETVLFIFLFITSILLAGCVVSDTHMQYSGVQRDHLRKIKPGVTTKDQLLDMVGEPTEESVIEDGVEILKYKCKMIKDDQFVLFPPPIIVDHKKETEHLVVFKIEDGVVQRHWKENIEPN
jgi:hypothetical protein